MQWIGVAQGLITTLIGVIVLRGGKGGRRVFGFVLIALGLITAVVSGLAQPRS